VENINLGSLFLIRLRILRLIKVRQENSLYKATLRVVDSQPRNNHLLPFKAQLKDLDQTQKKRV
jgi:hypothetical protein